MGTDNLGNDIIRTAVLIGAIATGGYLAMYWYFGPPDQFFAANGAVNPGQQ